MLKNKNNKNLFKVKSNLKRVKTAKKIASFSDKIFITYNDTMMIMITIAFPEKLNDFCYRMAIIHSHKTFLPDLYEFR